MTKRNNQIQPITALEISYLQALFQAETAMVVTLSLEGNIININPAGLKLAEVDPDQNIIGHQFASFIQPSQRERFMRMHDHVINGYSETFSCWNGRIERECSLH